MCHILSQLVICHELNGTPWVTSKAMPGQNKLESPSISIKYQPIWLQPAVWASWSWTPKCICIRKVLTINYAKQAPKRIVNAFSKAIITKRVNGHTNSLHVIKVLQFSLGRETLRAFDTDAWTVECVGASQRDGAICSESRIHSQLCCDRKAAE